MFQNSLPKGVTNFTRVAVETLLVYLKLMNSHNDVAYKSSDLAGINDYITNLSDKFLDFPPWELPGKTNLGRGNGVWYFLYRRTLKYPKGKCYKRNTETGYWKETGDHKKKRILVYHQGRPGKGRKTNWVLHEYELLDPTNGSPGDYVIGCLIEKPSTTRKKRKETSEGDSADDLTFASDDCVGIPENSNVHTPPREKAPKRKKKSNEVQFSEEQAFNSGINVPLPEAQHPTVTIATKKTNPEVNSLGGAESLQPIPSKSFPFQTQIASPFSSSRSPTQNMCQNPVSTNAEESDNIDWDELAEYLASKPAIGGASPQ